jgi:hypothetical protein
MRTEPVKYSAGACRDGCEPLRVMVIVCDSVLDAADGTYELGVPLGRFTPTHPELKRNNVVIVAANGFISVLSIASETGCRL